MLTITRTIRRIVRLARPAARSEEGAVAPLMGLMLLMLIGCTGIAIDTGRSMVVKARLVSALDAAGLAVGARTTTVDYTADARKFVDANFKANYAAATVNTVTATLSADKSTITLAASATMPTIFMKLFGSNEVTVKASTEITRASTGLELVLVLDNTGSMGQSGSMPSLKSGASSLVEGLFTNSPTDVFIGLVPFSQAVSIGPSLTTGAALSLPATYVQATSLVKTGYTTYYTGCLEERTGGLDVTDDPPVLLNANSLFKAYYSPDTATKKEVKAKDSEAQVNDWITPTWLGNNYNVFYTGYGVDEQQGPAAYCPQAMTPMTNNKTKLLTAINAMTAQGSTFINIGAVWGWRMLSPNWRGFWGGDMLANKQPLAYGTKNMSKVAVIMTDGENSFTPKYYSAYGYLSEGRLGETKRSLAESELDDRLKKVCNSMKANDITVMTIAYDNPDASTKSMLQACATNTSYYFDAGSSSELIKSFDLIRGALSKLRVSK
ncbi:pilus assembly protein [Chenggangzhangella methanolivorans]|uniref:Pilus assembly protein n=1 Tax=Chenggangzhangella methanolivorans TaxID=1437009 RepID=A0A9E6UPK9_9HYPH|nr:pilus assembly protein [Chenggangzhangella methanolivorans]QZN99869.1 pilus assembly protein [Chenggangzhangella methanolivorans]